MKRALSTGSAEKAELTLTARTRRIAAVISHQQVRLQKKHEMICPTEVVLPEVWFYAIGGREHAAEETHA
jgi:hypothetical protein